MMQILNTLQSCSLRICLIETLNLQLLILSNAIGKVYSFIHIIPEEPSCGLFNEFPGCWSFAAIYNILNKICELLQL